MTSRERRTVRVGLLGAGTVGSALIAMVEGRSELGFQLTRALVRDLGKLRPAPIPRELLTVDPDEVLRNCDVLVDVMGGVGLATDLTLRFLESGKTVVTANKAALAERWQAFTPHIGEGRVHFEAAVMAGTPAVGPLSQILRCSQPLELHAILNGTCNYIVGQLEAGVSYDEALIEAQRLGFAEADPTLDVGGYDTAHKLSLLARLGFAPDAPWEDLRTLTRGIDHLTPSVVREVMEQGGRVRLVGSVVPKDDSWRLSVRPIILPVNHPLIAASGSKNGLLFRGDPVGEVVISGPGAGGGPTASSVLADIVAVVNGRSGPLPLSAAAPVPKGYVSEDLVVLK
jgi:homoserine dehydrogenase